MYVIHTLSYATKVAENKYALEKWRHLATNVKQSSASFQQWHICFSGSFSSQSWYCLWFSPNFRRSNFFCLLCMFLPHPWSSSHPLSHKLQYCYKPLAHLLFTQDLISAIPCTMVFQKLNWIAFNTSRTLLPVLLLLVLDHPTLTSFLNLSIG